MNHPLITPLNDCKRGILHDFKLTAEYPSVKFEECRECGEKQKWNKDEDGRIDNAKYLEAHRRDFLQREGPSAKLFYMIYQPENYDANKHKWILHL